MSSTSVEAGDAFQVIVRGAQFNQEVLNKYLFLVTSVTAADPAGAIPWLTLWNAFKVAYMRPLINHQMEFSHDELIISEYLYTVEGYDMPAEFLDAYTLTGEVTSGDCMPPYVAYGVRLVRPFGGIRHGQKRLAGVPEVYSDGESALVPALAWGGWADHYMAGWQDDLDNENAGTSTVVVKPAYTISNPAGVKSQVLVQGVLYPKMSSQNTRKIGRGS